jgi:hypothetical protein
MMLEPLMPEAGERERRLASVVAGVCAAALQDAGAVAIALLHPETPEAALLRRWLTPAAGIPELRPLRAAAEMPEPGTRPAATLLASPATKSVLLLGGALPLVDLLPLGDVWTSQVAELAGAWSGPEHVAALASAAGGMEVLDAALMRLVDRRFEREEAMAGLAPEVAAEVLRLYDAGRHFRLRPRLVPKLAARTLGIDLFD